MENIQFQLEYCLLLWVWALVGVAMAVPMMMGLPVAMPMSGVGVGRCFLSRGKMEVLFFAYELNRNGIGWLTTSAGSTHNAILVKQTGRKGVIGKGRRAFLTLDDSPRNKSNGQTIVRDLIRSSFPRVTSEK